jgi:hypothetical protein
MPSIIRECHIHLVIFCGLMVVIHGCGETPTSVDPSAGITDQAPGETSPDAPAAAPGPSAAVDSAPLAPADPHVTLSLIESLPATVGAEVYLTEAAIMTGITAASRNILFQAAQSDWLVTPRSSTLNEVMAYPAVFFNIYSENNSADTRHASSMVATPRRWSVPAVDIDSGAVWNLTSTIKIPLLSTTGTEKYCALLSSQKKIHPGPELVVDVKDFALAVSAGPCAMNSSTLINSLSAKTKITPGDTKQVVAVVMGNLGLQVMNQTLWCWVGTPVTSGCAKTTNSYSTSSPTLSCDCEIRFDASGKVSSQKGVAGAVLDLTKW